jgi:hypothetical protein
VAPKVREMDENESMDPEIITALFDQGVRIFVNYSASASLLMSWNDLVNGH